MLSKLIFLVGFLSISALSLESDPIDWKCTPGASSCFYVSPFESETSGGWKLFSWEEARERCKKLDPKADLATIHTKDEDEFVLGLIQSKVMEMGDLGEMSDYEKCWNSHVWIGFRYAAGTSHADRSTDIDPGFSVIPTPAEPQPVIRPRRTATENVFSWADSTFVGYQHEPNHWHPDEELEYVVMNDPTCTASIDRNDYGHRRWGWVEKTQGHQFARYLCSKTVA